VCRSKHAEPSVNFGKINSITKLHLVGISITKLHLVGISTEFNLSVVTPAINTIYRTCISENPPFIAAPELNFILCSFTEVYKPI
jgi:hypothetical protein